MFYYVEFILRILKEKLKSLKCFYFMLNLRKLSYEQQSDFV